VPVRAADVGPASQINVLRSEVSALQFEDALWDNTWTVDALVCSAGTSYEKDDAYRARARQEEKDRRVGYPTAIMQAMKDAGASVVALFPSDYLGGFTLGLNPDCGLNRIYVGDDNYNASAALLRACRMAVRSVCVGGTGVQVLPMALTSLSATIELKFWTVPEQFDAISAKADAAAAVVEYFRTRENPFIWQSSGIRARLYNAVPNVQAITLTMSSPEPVLATMFQTVPLPRYVLDASRVTVNLTGP
jgi:hypothetical protein